MANQIHPHENNSHEKFSEVLNTFAGISQEDYSLVKNFFYLRSIRKGGYFIRAGEESKSFAFIYRGLFRSYYCNEEGDEFIRNFVKPNEIIAAYSSFLSKTNSIVYIQALKDSLILECRFDDFIKRTKDILAWERFRRILSDLLFVQKEIREYEFLTLDAIDRYKIFIKRFGSLEEEIQDYHIASYLGITPVSFSRIRKKLK
ncbi:MAG: Crp/Fnr family transcriptional regulator [Leptospiraceae bacterium]|nr:Crp/Fnr family transcriptional regulator [Leptospiraceae bacterium]